MALVSLATSPRRTPTPRGAAPVVAVDGVTLDIEAGDVYGIIGYSGAGKSTLVRLVNAPRARHVGQHRASTAARSRRSPSASCAASGSASA